LPDFRFVVPVRFEDAPATLRFGRADPFPIAGCTCKRASTRAHIYKTIITAPKPLHNAGEASSACTRLIYFANHFSNGKNTKMTSDAKMA
jgi:hypothetical protein